MGNGGAQRQRLAAVARGRHQARSVGVVDDEVVVNGKKRAHGRVGDRAVCGVQGAVERGVGHSRQGWREGASRSVR